MSDYTASGKPLNGARNIAKVIRDEFALIETALNSKLNENLFALGGTEAQGATVNDYVVTVSPAITAYTSGSVVMFLSTHANTGAATLKISALTAKTLKDVDGNALASGDIASGALVAAYYDGTDFYLISGNDRVARGGDTYTGTHDFSGATVTVTTQAAGDNTTKPASTAYVYTNFAALSSPAFTDIPTAPTAAVGTNTNQIATMAAIINQAFLTALPSQTGNAGKIIETDGTTASWKARVVYTKTAVTLLANVEHKLDSTDAAFTVTMPATGTLGDTIPLIDPLGTWATNNVTVDRNGHNFKDPQGTAQAENLTLDQNNMKTTLFYDGTNWRLI